MVGMQPVAGSLLIASARLMDPNFRRCVLLVLDHDAGGTLGVILNRPSETSVGDVLEPWQHMTTDPGVFFRGGPVELNAALALGALRDSATPPSGWRSLDGATTTTTLGSLGSLGLVDLDSSPDDFLGRLTALRVYAGYTGWAADQLDDEIAEGSWHVVPATPADLFTSAPEQLWGQVLRRQPTPLSFLATLPDDVNLN
jgi:putative transcriptional regulator